MLSSERVQPVAGPSLLEQLGRLIVRARSDSPSQRLSPSTSQVHIQTQPDDVDPRLEANLSSHINALWTEQIPVCVEVLLAPDCVECYAAMTSAEPCAPRGLLLERWTMEALLDKSESPSVISSPWLLNAVRSQLHFSQLSAWRARMQPRHERRRKLSREQCYKKVESSCVDTDRKLMVIYSVHNGDRKVAEFRKPPTDHTFPLTDIGNNKYLKVVLESLPRIDDIPDVKCACVRTDVTATDELVGRLNDLNIGSRKYDGAINSNIGTPSRRLSIISNPGSNYIYPTEKKDILDDRMHTPCNENGKHKCNCDDESDGKEKRKLDERRLKEIAKYKRKIRKELKKYDSTSSEGEKTKETTSIPILQASRFDRFRAIGCYRNQTYLTLPASRIETKSPFIETENLVPEFNKTIEKTSIGTQTDFICDCGKELEIKCDSCSRGMVRSQANYNLASLGARRKLDEQDNEKSLKKLKCDTNVDSFSDGVVKRPKLKRFLFSDRLDKIVTDRNRNTEKDIKDLHLKTDDSVFSIPKETKSQHEYHHTSTKTDDIDLDRENGEPSSQNGGLVSQNGGLNSQNGGPSFNLDSGDSRFSFNMDERFSTPKENKRQKTFSISDDDYVFYEKCDYGTIDRHEVESPQEEKFTFSTPEKSETPGPENLQSFKEGFIFPKPKRDHSEVPSPSEMDRFRWRFDSAASMVFHSKTGLPLTSSPAPLRRGSSCFDFDDSINGISGIKSAMFHPISPVSPGVPTSPASPAPIPRPPTPRRGGKLKVGSSTGLLGSFEESALQGRLEAVATVHGFTAELGASGAFCPPHKRLPVTVFFYAPGGTAAPYMGHIALGPGGYRVARSGTVQVSLFNPHGTLVKMFVVLYDLTRMPHAARTFLRQRTLYMPCGAAPPRDQHRWLRYLIHLRFMTSKTGKLYLHTDIRLIVSRKADLDTATAHSALMRPPASLWRAQDPPNRAPPNRVFGGSSEHDSDENSDEQSVSYELRSFTYAPDNPKYSPR